MKRVIGLILTTVSLAALTGCSSTPTRDETAYLRDLERLMGRTVLPGHEASLISAGDKVCEGIGQPGVTRALLVQSLTASGLWTAATAEGYTAIVERDLCPGKQYAPAQPVQVAAPATPAPPPGTIGAGVYEVGSDVTPGTYKTPGPDGTHYTGCTWSRLRNTSGSSDSVITFEAIQGPGVVTIVATDGGFETRGCMPWTKVR